MGKIDIDRLCRDFEDCLGWPYITPGGTAQDCSRSGIDCSGMFVRAYKLQGQRIYHGSNTIWREHLSTKGPLKNVGQLQRGMAVFKWNPNTPSKFSDGLGDFQHIGLVTSVNPLRIVHASTDGMRVRADTKLGKWRYWGWLKAADPMTGNAKARDAPEAPALTDAAPPAQDLPKTLRHGARGDTVVRLQRLLRDAGYDLSLDGIFGPMTEESVKSYQYSRGLEADGIVGPMTWGRLLG